MISAVSSSRGITGQAFTLVELLVAMAVGTALLLMLLTLANHTGNTWNHNSSLIEKRRTARALQEFLTADLTRAALPIAKPSTAAECNLQFVLNPPDAALPSDILHFHALFWQTTNATNSHMGEIAEVGYFVVYQEVNNQPQFQLCRFFVNAAQSDPNAASDVTKYTANPDFLIYDQKSRFNWLNSTVLAKYRTPAPPNYRGLFADGVIAFWVRCLDPLGKQITKSAAYTQLDGTVVPSADYDNAYDSTRGYEYTDSTTTPVTIKDVAPPALPAAVEITAILVDSSTLARLSLTDAHAIRDLNTNSANNTRPVDIQQFITQSLPQSIQNAAVPFYITIYPKNSL